MVYVCTVTPYCTGCEPLLLLLMYLSINDLLDYVFTDKCSFFIKRNIFLMQKKFQNFL